MNDAKRCVVGAVVVSVVAIAVAVFHIAFICLRLFLSFKSHQNIQQI